MPDVTIPADVAKAIARWMREEVGPTPSGYHKDWPDMLDPRPPSLREQVADCLVGLPEVRAHQAGLVLAVVADWLAAQPLHPNRGSGNGCHDQRDADVALIRGGAE